MKRSKRMSLKDKLYSASRFKTLKEYLDFHKEYNI